MARTYGEIQSSSFSAVFDLATDRSRAFIDIGSGHGLITISSVLDYSFVEALGVEKYREPQSICEDNVKQLPADIKARLKFVLEDINNLDLIETFRSIDCAQLLIFCNNLAFSTGTLNRLASRMKDAMEMQTEKQIIFVSTVPLPTLQAEFQKFIHVNMSWTDKLHECCVYSNVTLK